MRLPKFLNVPTKYQNTASGIFDALFVLTYITYNLTINHFPYIYDYEDIMMYWGLNYSPTGWHLWEFRVKLAFWLLYVSMIFSAFLFFMRWQVVKYFILIQTPIYILFVLAVTVSAIFNKSAFAQAGFAVLVLVMLFFLRVRITSAWSITALTREKGAYVRKQR